MEVSIQSINNQKLHGAVLCVERHLKARRQTNNNQTVAQPKVSLSAKCTHRMAYQRQQYKHSKPFSCHLCCVTGR